MPAQVAKATRAKATPHPAPAVLRAPALSMYAHRVLPHRVPLHREQVAATTVDPAHRAAVRQAATTTEATAPHPEVPLRVQDAVAAAIVVAAVQAQAQAAVAAQDRAAAIARVATAAQAAAVQAAVAEEDNYRTMTIV